MWTAPEGYSDWFLFFKSIHNVTELCKFCLLVEFYPGGSATNTATRLVYQCIKTFYLLHWRQSVTLNCFKTLCIFNWKTNPNNNISVWFVMTNHKKGITNGTIIISRQNGILYWFNKNLNHWVNESLSHWVPDLLIHLVTVSLSHYGVFLFFELGTFCSPILLIPPNFLRVKPF